METDSVGKPANKWAAVFGSAAKAAVPSPATKTTALSPSGDFKAAAIEAADPTVLATADAASVEAQLLEVLAAGTGRPLTEVSAGEKAPDGSVALDSMRAVFLCSVVAAVLGPDGIEKFRGNSKAKDFKSIGSVSALVRRLRKAVVAA